MKKQGVKKKLQDSKINKYLSIKRERRMLPSFLVLQNVFQLPSIKFSFYYLKID